MRVCNAWVDCLTGPEGCLGLLIHLPDGLILDGEEDESIGVLGQERLLEICIIAQD